MGHSCVLVVEVSVSRALPRSRKMLALMAGTALAAPLALAGPVSAAEPGAYTVTPLTFTVDAGGRTCTVEADLYR